MLAAAVATCSCPAQTGSLRFAWLSDTHVGGETGAEDLAEAVLDINTLATSETGPQFVLLSGDITEYGSDAQLEEAKRILKQLTIPAYVLPGNHDTKWSASGGTTFLRHWGTDRFLFEREGITFIGMHQGPRMKMADGHWAPEDLRWLDTTLSGLHDPSAPIILVTHYPVDSSIANWYEALDRFAPFGLRAILVGHGHRRQLDSYEGIPGIMNRSTLRGSAQHGGYSLCRIERDTLFVDDRSSGLRTTAGVLAIPFQRTPARLQEVQKRRPDFSANQRYRGVKRAWSYGTGYTIAASAAVGEGRVIAGDASGTLHAVRLSDGRPLWKFRTAGPIYSTPFISGPYVVFGSADSTVYCLSLSTGGMVWRYPTRAPVVASPVIEGGTVFIGSSDGSFRALDLDTGTKRWTFDSVSGFVECRPLLEGGAIYFGAWDETLYALDAATGSLRWKWRGGRPGILYSPAACWPVASSGKVFIVAPDRFMTALEGSTGRIVWRSGAHQVRETIGISGDRRHVYARTMRDSVIAFTAAPGQPERVWIALPGFGYDINSSMLVEREGVVYGSTKGGFVYALDANDGALLWVHRVSPGAVHTPTPAGKGSVAVTDFDGRITLLRAD